MTVRRRLIRLPFSGIYAAAECTARGVDARVRARVRERAERLYTQSSPISAHGVDIDSQPATFYPVIIPLRRR